MALIYRFLSTKICFHLYKKYIPEKGMLPNSVKANQAIKIPQIKETVRWGALNKLSFSNS